MIKKSSLNRLKEDSGITLIETGVAVVMLVTLSLAIIDIVNVMRARTSLQEVAHTAAGYYAKLGKSSDTSPSSIPNTVIYSTQNQDETALQRAKDEFKAMFPRSNFDCGNSSAPNCARISVSQPAPSRIRVWVSLDVPTLLFGGTSQFFTLANAQTRVVERSKMPSSMVDFDHAFLDDDE